ncbi:MAG TPA: PAS domain S-box protein [Nocardioides sp.]|nr:PAS domain S-box protein [Nocardioides sp.]
MGHDPTDGRAEHNHTAEVLRDLLDAMAEGVVETTPDGRLLVANRAYAEMLGYDDVADLLRSVQNVRELYAHPFERTARVAQVEAEGRHLLDVELRRRDGSSTWVRARAVAHRDESGAVTSISAVVEDVTGIRDAERHLEAERERTRLAFDHNPVPLAVLGLREDGRQGLVAVNRAAEELFGYPPGELLHVSPGDLMDPQAVQKEVALLSGLLADSAGSVAEIETRRRRADGTYFPARIRAATFRSADGGSYTISALEDLTQRKAAEAAIGALARQRYQLLQELVRVETEERERMAADVHDHLIQLLVSASLRLQVVLEEDPESGVADALAAVNAATRRLRGMLRHLEPVTDGASVPAAVRSAAHHLFDGTGVRVEVTGALQEAPPSTTSALLHCVREALTNARSHANASVVEVHLRSDDLTHEIVVLDDGVGLDEAAPERPGHRGLRSMRTRAEAVGGNISLGPGVGGGTQVRIVVPREHVFAGDDDAEQEPLVRVVQPGA